MVSEQLKRTLNQFTKEELIEGIIKSNYGNKNEILAVIDACYSVKLSKVEQAVKTASRAWEKASNEYLKYLKELENEYENIVYAPPFKLSKLHELKSQENKLYNALEILQDNLSNCYKNCIKPTVNTSNT